MSAAADSPLPAPQPLLPQHLCNHFDCGEPVLDDWLKRRALGNHLSGASRTFVVIDPEQRVVGYYAMAAGAVSHNIAPGGIRRNMPEPIPVLVLARLAVDRRMQGRQLGGALLQDAVTRAMGVAQQVGARALLVHAISEPACRFYLHYGFIASPMQPMTLMLRLN